MKKFLPLALIVFLSACGSLDFFGDETDNRLVGERLSLYDFEKTLQQDPNTKFGMDGSEAGEGILRLSDIQSQNDTAMLLDGAWTNKFWPQVGGYPNHTMKHLNFNAQNPKRIWSTSIGKGASKRMPLTSPPIIADTMAFTLNNKAEIRAFNIVEGDEVWDRKIGKPNEDEIVIGGGLAFSGGRLFATNGFNEVIALSPENGAVLWRTATKSPVRAAPSAIPDTVFVTTLDNETIALNAATGQKIWSHRGLSSGASVLGAATPAISRDAVITAYASGEIYALQIKTGMELWSVNLSPIAQQAGRTNLTDIQALPVIDKGVVYAASFANRMAAIDARTGAELWQVPFGIGSTPWVSGNRIFAIESQGTLVSIARDKGEVVWQTQLKPFEDMKDKEDPITWIGPYLANNTIMAFGSHGEVHIFDPVTGEKTGDWDIRDELSLAPAIAENVLYAVTNNGRLSAWK